MESILNQVIPFKKENYIITRNVYEDVNFDGSLGATLWNESTCYAVSSCSKGLDDYYNMLEDYPEYEVSKELEEVLTKAKDLTKDSWVITQLQGVNSKTKPQGLNYRYAMARFWINNAIEAGQDELYMLSADMNVWNLLPIKFALADQNLPMTSTKQLKPNYDHTAKRFFKYDPETKLYRKNLR
jgi:hypothetical protein